MKKILVLVALFFGWVGLPGCSTTSHIPPDRYLLRSAKVKLQTDRTFADKGALNDQINAIMSQKPNTFLFGAIPYKVWLYNIRYKKYQHDTTNFQLKSGVVERPEVLDTALVAVTKKNIHAFLRNQGFFYARVDDSIAYRKRKAYLTYKVVTGTDYAIDEVSYQIEDPGIAALEPQLKEGNLLSKGTGYSNTLVGAERRRLSNVIKDHGYYLFSADNIDFELDTLDKNYFRNMENPFESAINFLTLKRQQKKPTLNVKVIIRNKGDSTAFQKYTFRNVVVMPDYMDSADYYAHGVQDLEVNGLRFRYKEKYVNTSILDKKIFIRPGKLYSQADYNNTIRQLNDLGIFQYVRVFFNVNTADTLGHTLNCFILMNKSPRYDYGTSVEVSGGDLYAIGTAANISVMDKNFLKGANQLSATLSYGVELEQNDASNVPIFKRFDLFSQNLGINFRLTFPKFILPVNQNKFSQRALPKTFLTAGVNSLQRHQYFNLVSINSSYGYVWNESALKTWSVKPIFVNTLHLRNISEAFQAKMDTIPAIRNSYQETFIEGEAIEYVINTEGRNKRKHAYLRLAGEEAGALLSGTKGLAELLGTKLGFNHAKYVRFDFDARQYLMSRNASLALHFYGGVGIPYGGSTILPYLKQYFVGGAYSIRGWRPRVLGPGSYYDSSAQNSSNNLFIDQSGDIKLEFNAEYRFAMIRLFSGAMSLNGAIFTDIGNIWLTNKQERMPGANFAFGRLYQDLAMSTGAGLRVDFDGFLVVRFDWAFPMKKPYVLENGGWVVKEMDLGDPDWRRQNLNFNLAIGYPF